MTSKQQKQNKEWRITSDQEGQQDSGGEKQGQREVGLDSCVLGTAYTMLYNCSSEFTTQVTVLRPVFPQKTGKGSAKNQ